MEYLLIEGSEKARLFICSSKKTDAAKEMAATAKDLIGQSDKVVRYWPKGSPQDAVMVDNLTQEGRLKYLKSIGYR